jgi:hypothetical protein
VIRNGREDTLTLTLGELPRERQASRESKRGTRLN